MNRGESKNKRKRRIARMRANDGMLKTDKFLMTLDKGMIPIPVPDVHENLDKAIIKEILAPPVEKKKRKVKSKPPPPVPTEEAVHA